MRSEREIKRAIELVTESLCFMSAMGEQNAVDMASMTLAILKWAADDPGGNPHRNPFEAMLAGWEKAKAEEAAEARHAAN